MNARKYHQSRWLRHLLSGPFIYGMIVPIVLLDVGLEIYHRICFPLYGLAYVSRSKYIKIDRHRLQYLNTIQKLNCMYCGYANGLAAYTVEIFAQTERYWCGIQHARSRDFHVPKHHTDFTPYGDKTAFERQYPKGVND